jgi:hypothetical protein
MSLLIWVAHRVVMKLLHYSGVEINSLYEPEEYSRGILFPEFINSISGIRLVVGHSREHGQSSYLYSITARSLMP